MKKAETQKFFDQFHKQGHQKMRIDEYFHLQKIIIIKKLFTKNCFGGNAETSFAY